MTGTDHIDRVKTIVLQTGVGSAAFKQDQIMSYDTA